MNVDLFTFSEGTSMDAEHHRYSIFNGSSAFRVGETDRGAPLGEQRSRCRLTR